LLIVDTYTKLLTLLGFITYVAFVTRLNELIGSLALVVLMNVNIPPKIPFEGVYNSKYVPGDPDKSTVQFTENTPVLNGRVYDGKTPPCVTVDMSIK
jgi:hypothetical protein